MSKTFWLVSSNTQDPKRTIEGHTIEIKKINYMSSGIHVYVSKPNYERFCKILESGEEKGEEYLTSQNNSSNRAAVIGIMIYIAAMLFGILKCEYHLILLGCLWTFFYGLLTMSFIQGIKKVTDCFSEAVGSPVSDKISVALVSFIFALVVFGILDTLEEWITLPIKCLQMQNLGNTIMGFSLILLIIDSGI